MGQQIGNSSTLPNIIPPSPTAYALGNYGNVPIGLFTGSSNLSVSLFAYKTSNTSLPLNLFYGSNGIRVDEISTNVGLGWNLNFGGVITRTVRDKADETAVHITTPEIISGAYSNPVTNQFLDIIGNGSDALDTEADLYSFNFNGYSGKFFYDQNNQPHIVNQQALKIERIGNANGDGQDFLLTLPTGEKYYFTEKERTAYRSMGNGHLAPSSAITSWYLTKILHPKGDEIYFTYNSTTLSEYIGSRSQTLRMSVGYPAMQPSCTGSGYGQAPTVGPLSDNTIEILGKKIISIASNNPDNGNVTFEYEADSPMFDIPGNRKIKNISLLDKNGSIIEITTFNYLNTPNKRNFLNSVVFKDSLKSYNFEYESPAQFPERLSKAQDHWGYYNGAINSNLVPKNIQDYGFNKFNYGGGDKEPYPNFSKLGMLRKIIYPTKGYTELEYEGNTYWGEKTVYPPIFIKQLQIKTDNATPDNSVEYVVTSPIDQTISINATLSGNSIPLCSSMVGSGHIAGSVEIGQGNFHPLTRDNAAQNISLDVTAGSTIKFTLHADFGCSNVRANISYYQTAPQTLHTNLDTGGVRIKSTKDHDGSTAQPIYRRYYYAHKDDITHSSGHKGNKAYYTDTNKTQIACYSDAAPGGCTGVVENTDVFLTSSSMVSLYDTGITSCLYKFITISEGGDDFEKGGEMKEFKVRRDGTATNIWGWGLMSNTPWTNKGWDNGIEIKSLILRKNTDNDLDIIQEKESLYEKNDTATFELKNFTGRAFFNPACGNTPSHPYTCTADDVIKPNNLCTAKSVGTTVNLKHIDNLGISEYRTISYWSYIKSKKTTDFLNGVPLKTETEYFYNNPLHYQLTKTLTTDPDLSIEEKSFQYAHEKGNTKLINANIVGVPLETTVLKKQNSTEIGKVISKQETKYDDPTNLFPSSVLSQNIQTNVMSTELTYDQYNSKGNILQYTTKDNIPTTIIWGYNSTQPIAKVIGISYSVASTLASEIIAASDADINEGTEQTLIDKLDAFRKSTALQNAQISTYTYDPLIGVTSITPPSGIREIYKYDSANRLESIKDVNGKIIKEFQYNYKH
ncbi:hypothetical protein [Chryseobacterium indoltheticum]|uniref:hypothetical protein n=1 Tax=Chryseobacterium indoltheticum TaxID=254 RepID=UPI001911370D|nr:hypothetical protein [Chryseobacterium indoltheticum]QQQ26545.1 hypothetical protein JJL46_10425 [Chryseobacterium indoltheticum]